METQVHKLLDETKNMQEFLDNPKEVLARKAGTAIRKYDQAVVAQLEQFVTERFPSFVEGKDQDKKLKRFPLSRMQSFALLKISSLLEQLTNGSVGKIERARLELEALDRSEQAINGEIKDLEEILESLPSFSERGLGSKLKSFLEKKNTRI